MPLRPMEEQAEAPAVVSPSPASQRIPKSAETLARAKQANMSPEEVEFPGHECVQQPNYDASTQIMLHKSVRAVLSHSVQGILLMASSVKFYMASHIHYCSVTQTVGGTHLVA